MSEKLVTIITSVYRPKFFKEFVEDTLSQTIFEDVEWKILEVGVSEKSYKKTLPENVCYKTLDSRISVYEAWNTMICDSSAPYIANYNVDDRSATNHLESLTGILEIYDDASMVYCPNLETNKENETFKANSSLGRGFPCFSFDPFTYWRNNSAHARPCWRRSLHKKHGMFDTSYKVCSDYEFWLRCINGGEIFYKISASPLYLYHRNNEGVSSSDSGVKKGMEEIKLIQKTYLNGRGGAHDFNRGKNPTQKLPSPNLSCPTGYQCISG